MARFKILASLPVAALVFCCPDRELAAQAITAEVVGAVTDASGAAVPAAIVTVTHVQTNQSRKTTIQALMGYPACLYLPVSYPTGPQPDPTELTLPEENLRNKKGKSVTAPAANTTARYT